MMRTKECIMTKVAKALSDAQVIDLIASEIIDLCSSLRGDNSIKTAACYVASIIFQQAAACESIRNYKR